MNQILYTAEGKAHNPLPIQTIVKFFAFSIIALGVIFLGEGVYSLFTNTPAETAPGAISVPKIEFAKDGNNATVSITHTVGINMVKYNWNGRDEKIVNGKSEKEMLISDLSIPSGENTLYIEVIDDNNKSTKSYYDYTYDGISIELSVVNNSKIKITATDITGMSYMTYKWNSENEVTVYPNQEGDITIEQSTEIPSGLNTLYITAINTSNITLTKKQEIKGNKRPKISYYIEDTTFYITATDEEGVKSISLKINDGDELTFDGEGKKEFTCSYDIGNQDILAIITATDVDDVSETVACKNY